MSMILALCRGTSEEEVLPMASNIGAGEDDGSVDSVIRDSANCANHSALRKDTLATRCRAAVDTTADGALAFSTSSVY
jgi:hypothetical protein